MYTFFFITAYKETHHIRSYCALVSTFSVWSPLKEATLTCDTKVYNLLAESSSSLRIRAKRTRTLKGVPLKNENQFNYKHSIQRFQLKKNNIRAELNENEITVNLTARKNE